MVLNLFHSILMKNLQFNNEWKWKPSFGSHLPIGTYIFKFFCYVKQCGGEDILQILAQRYNTWVVTCILKYCEFFYFFRNIVFESLCSLLIFQRFYFLLVFCAVYFNFSGDSFKKEMSSWCHSTLRKWNMSQIPATYSSAN